MTEEGSAELSVGESAELLTTDAAEVVEAATDVLDALEVLEVLVTGGRVRPK